METAIAKRKRVQPWRLSLRKYVAVLRVSIAHNLAYMTEIFFRAFMLVIIVFIMIQLWKTTFSLRGAKALSGFSMSDIVWYLATVEALVMSMPPLTRRIDLEVRSGQLVYQLGRPCNYLLYNYAHYLGERLVRLGINIIVVSLLAWSIAGWPHLTWMGLVAWPLMAWLALSIDFVAYFSIGLLAFWIEETRSLSTIFSRLTLVLGGVLAPLDIFPQPFRSIAQALPFSAILYGPASVLIRFDLNRFIGVLGQQVITLAVGCVILLLVYQVAIRRVNLNGG